MASSSPTQEACLYFLVEMKLVSGGECRHGHSLPHLPPALAAGPADPSGPARAAGPADPSGPARAAGPADPSGPARAAGPADPSGPAAGPVHTSCGPPQNLGRVIRWTRIGQEGPSAGRIRAHHRSNAPGSQPALVPAGHLMARGTLYNRLE
jgi:hypothetical protein